jgi:hypothetical protein
VYIKCVKHVAQTYVSEAQAVNPTIKLVSIDGILNYTGICMFSCKSHLIMRQTSGYNRGDQGRFEEPNGLRCSAYMHLSVEVEVSATSEGGGEFLILNRRPGVPRQGPMQ